MQLFKNLASHKLAVLLCFALLVCQAFCDLSLPNLTSQIVNVGIQQSGVEHPSPEKLTASTHDAMALMLEGEDQQLYQAAYAQNGDGTYGLTKSGEDNWATLDQILALPLLLIHPTPSMMQVLGEGYDADAVVSSLLSGALPREGMAETIGSIQQTVDRQGSNLLSQQAILAVQAEYQDLGYNLNDMQMGYLMVTGGKMIGLAALAMAIVVLLSLIASRTAATVARDLRSKFFSKVLSFSEREINSFSAASLITRGTNDIQLIQMVTTMLMRIVLYAPILAVGGIVMVAMTAPSMAWIIAIAIAWLFVVIAVLLVVTMPKFKMMQKLIDQVNLVAREILTGLPVIRAFGRESHEQVRFEDASERLMRTQLFTNRVMTFMMPILMFTMNGVSVAIIWFGGIRISEGVLQTGDLIALITYSMVIIMSFLMLGMLAILLPRASVAANRVNEVITTESSIKDPERPLDDKLGSLDTGVEIAFNQVDFAFDDESENALTNITFTFPAGKTSAIVGPTGSGKSTIVKLIERFYDVSSGSVTVDGVDVRDLSQHALRQQFGYVPQAAFLFSGTIGSNVGYGAGEEDPERIATALEIAQAADFVASKDEGLEAPVAQGGTNVLGGQRQRLAIARALGTAARGYLFDDSFSALDYRTDAALRGQIAEKLQGRTVVIVAQRIATIMAADHIVVLDDGAVVGQGTHAELMASCQTYRDIALSQLSPEELGIDPAPSTSTLTSEVTLEGGEADVR